MKKTSPPTIHMHHAIRRVCVLASTALFAAAAPCVPRTLLPQSSQIGFTVKEMGVPVTGEFKRFEATIDIDAAKPEKSSAALRIDVASLTTDNDEADAIAVDADWMDKAHAPYATFKSTSIRALAPGRYEAQGVLAIKNKERPLSMQFTSADQADGKTLISSEFNIPRSSFGIGGGVWNEGGVVSENILVKVRLLVAAAAAAH